MVNPQIQISKVIFTGRAMPWHRLFKARFTDTGTVGMHTMGQLTRVYFLTTGHDRLLYKKKRQYKRKCFRVLSVGLPCH